MPPISPPTTLCRWLRHERWLHLQFNLINRQPEWEELLIAIICYLSRALLPKETIVLMFDIIIRSLTRSFQILTKINKMTFLYLQIKGSCKHCWYVHKNSRMADRVMSFWYSTCRKVSDGIMHGKQTYYFF